MNDGIISTGNPVADNFIRKQLVDNVGLWALISYFETKGLLNRAEFFEFLNAEAKMIVHSIITAESSEQE
jgi:hypothetical protein